jgi:hypothetical protein
MQICKLCKRPFKNIQALNGHKPWHNKKFIKRLIAKNTGKGNGHWKGNKASIAALHLRIKRKKPKPKLCKWCKKRKPQELANLNHEYNVNDLKQWIWLCKFCHKKWDKRHLHIKIKCMQCRRYVSKRISIVKVRKYNFCNNQCFKKYKHAHPYMCRNRKAKSEIKYK